MSKMARNKGANGEREILKWFEENFAHLTQLRRNFLQSREGGCDSLSIPGIALEVKRQEQLSVRSWWLQATEQAVKVERMPVLAYRQNRLKWKFCIPASLVTLESWGYLTLEEDEFIKWYNAKATVEFN